MSIQELSIKFKGFLQNTDTLLTILIVCVSLASFVLGRYSMTEKTSEIQNQGSAVTTALTQEVSSSEPMKNEVKIESQGDMQTAEGGYVASKNGTKYHLPWCGSAKQIKEENKIWFVTKEEAEKAGYTPASNCKGI